MWHVVPFCKIIEICLEFAHRTKNKNISNYRYIGISILWIDHKYINKYFGKKLSISLKLIKSHENVRKIL